MSAPLDAAGRRKPEWSYIVTWGTCAALVRATSADEARRQIQARADRLTPGRAPLRINARRATARELEAITNDLYEGLR